MNRAILPQSSEGNQVGGRMYGVICVKCSHRVGAKGSASLDRPCYLWSGVLGMRFPDPGRTQSLALCQNA